jgi:hypothetical protein
MDKAEWQLQNEWYLEKFNLKYPKQKMQSFMGWKSLGRIVRKGERQKEMSLSIVAGTTTDPITGEDVPRHKTVTVYGFTEDQTDPIKR